MKEQLVRLTATGLYSGYGRPFPGTWGTIPAWLLGWYVIAGNQPALMVTTAAVLALSIWSAGEAEKLFGHDARKIVIDEWTGMLITFWLVPYSLTHYVIAFLAFRAFDVVKIPPASQCEQLPGGWGVTMDDVVAGIQANLFTQLVIWIMVKYSTA